MSFSRKQLNAALFQLRRGILVSMLMAPALPAWPAFANVSWNTAGSAALNQDGRVVITPAVGGQNGAVWNPCAIDMTQDFDLTFSLNFGTRACGADGMAFVIQPSNPNHVGGNAGAQASDGLGDSIIIVFDTYANVVAPYNDPPYDSLGIRTGNSQQNSGPSACGGTGITAGPTACGRPAISASQFNIKDGLDHTVQITFDAASRMIRVYVDGVGAPRAEWELPSGYISSVLGGNTMNYFGFTAATGGESNYHMMGLVGGTVNGGTDVTANPCAYTPTPVPPSTPTPIVIPTSDCGTPTPMPSFTFSPTPAPPTATITVSPTPYPPGCGTPVFEEARVLDSGCIGNAAPQTHAYSFASQPNQLLIVRMITSNTSTTPSNVQFGGVPMNLHVTHNVGGSNSLRLYAYYLANPPTTGPLTFDFANANCSWNIVTELWNNVDVSDPIGSFNTKYEGNAGSSSPFPFSFNVTTEGFASAVSVMINSDQAACCPAASVAPQTNMNLHLVGPEIIEGGGGQGVSGHYWAVGGAGTYTFNYEGTQANRWWDAQPIEIKGNQCGTPSNTPSPSPSPSDTSTPTATTSATPTLSFSPTPSNTFTASPIASDTVSPTISPTFTASPSASYTDTPTASATASMTSSITPSPTPTFSASPPYTDTVTPTFSSTFTNSPTPTVTPSFSGTPSITDTRSPTHTPTVSPSHSYTATPTVTPSSTFTYTVTATPTATMTHTPFLSPSPTPTFSVSPTITITRTPFTLGPLIEIHRLYPNPFTEVSHVYFTLREDSDVTFAVFNVAGEVVRIEKFYLPQGVHLHDWPGENDAGKRVASGTYIFRLSAESISGQSGEFFEHAVCVR